MQIKIAIVEDDEGIRSSLSALLRRAKDFKLVGEYRQRRKRPPGNPEAAAGRGADGHQPARA